MSVVLELHKVTKFFGQRCILKDVTLSLYAGSITLLMGANGAGKSTLLRIMAGLAKPCFGDVHRHVQEQALGYLGHATFVYPALTAKENLLFWAHMYGLPRSDSTAKALEDVLTRVQLLPFAEEKAGVFSRGMAQRLNLARILLLQPKLWLLDEPSTGLDVHSSQLLRQEVQKAQEGGAAIVWISHDMHNDAAMAQRVLHIEKARVREQVLASEGGVLTC